MTAVTRPRALIVGGSLSGLFAATALRAIGWEVQVFERSPNTLDSRGGGLVLQPDVLQALQFAGIRHHAALGVGSDDRIELDRHDQVLQRLAMPQTQTSWNLLYGSLKRALPADVVYAGERFVRLEQDGERVQAHFASGRVVGGDLLIGADGANSTVREQLMPRAVPAYAGYVAWRGLVPEGRLPAAVDALLAQAFAFQHGPGHSMLEYLVPGDDGSIRAGERRRNWVWYRPATVGADLDRLLTDRDGHRHKVSLPPGALADGSLSRLRDAAAELLAPSFRQLVAATDEPFLQAIVDLQVPQMVFGRALLLGDAAFVPRPHTAGSTAKAAANAVALAQALRTSPFSLPQALASWQQSQLDAGRAMVEHGRALGDRVMGVRRTA